MSTCVFLTVGNTTFLPIVHQNYIGTDSEKNPFFLSVVLSDQNNQRVPQYHSILWRKTVRNKYLIAALPFLFICFLVCFRCIDHRLFLLSSEFQYLICSFYFVGECIILP